MIIDGTCLFRIAVRISELLFGYPANIYFKVLEKAIYDFFRASKHPPFFLLENFQQTFRVRKYF